MRLMEVLFEEGIVPIPESSNMKVVTFPGGEMDCLLLSFMALSASGESVVGCTVLQLGDVTSAVLWSLSRCLETWCLSEVDTGNGGLSALLTAMGGGCSN